MIMNGGWVGFEEDDNDPFMSNIPRKTTRYFGKARNMAKSKPKWLLKTNLNIKLSNSSYQSETSQCCFPCISTVLL
jgi:hypothetical protein